MALKLGRKAKTYNTEQKRLRYTEGQPKKAALDQVIPYWDEETGEDKLDSMKTLIELLDFTFGDQDKATTARRKLLGLK